MAVWRSSTANRWSCRRGTSTRPSPHSSSCAVLRLQRAVTSFYWAYTVLAVRRCRRFSSTICRRCSTSWRRTSVRSLSVAISTFTSTCTTTRTRWVWRSCYSAAASFNTSPSPHTRTVTLLTSSSPGMIRPSVTYTSAAWSQITHLSTSVCAWLVSPQSCSRWPAESGIGCQLMLSRQIWQLL